ncbi:MAG: hypothetical protein WC159_08250 [Sphaerochaetaceae bacterium]
MVAPGLMLALMARLSLVAVAVNRFVIMAFGGLVWALFATLVVVSLFLVMEKQS